MSGRPRLTGNEAAGASLAATFRERFDLGHTPIKDVFEVVHTALGVDVLSMEASEDQHGLSMINPSNGALVIAVATTAHPMRLRSTVAHEVGHVVAGDLIRGIEFVPGARSPEEIRADAFARHLLLPFDGVRARIGGGRPAVGEAELSALVQEFEVSPAIAALQLKMLRLIDDQQRAAWRTLTSKALATRFGWLSQYQSLARDAQQPRAPQTLMAVSVEAYRRGHLGITEVARWYHEDVTVLREQLGAGSSPGQGSAPADAEDDGWDDDAPLFGSATPRAPGPGGLFRMSFGRSGGL